MKTMIWPWIIKKIIIIEIFRFILIMENNIYKLFMSITFMLY